MPHRKGNRIRQVSNEELARQACDLWDKFDFVPIMARFLTLHDELDRRHGGKGGSAKFINAEKKQRNKAKGFTPYPGPVSEPAAEEYDARAAVRDRIDAEKTRAFIGGPGSEAPQRIKLYPERDLLEMVDIVREIEKTVDDPGIGVTFPDMMNRLKRLCRRALRNYPTQGKSDVRHDATGRKS